MNWCTMQQSFILRHLIIEWLNSYIVWSYRHLLQEIKMAVVSWNISMVFEKRDWRKSILYLRGVNVLLTFPLSSFDNSNVLHCFLFAAYDSRLLFLLPYLASSRAHTTDVRMMKDSLFLSFQLLHCVCVLFSKALILIKPLAPRMQELLFPSYGSHR